MIYSKQLRAHWYVLPLPKCNIVIKCFDIHIIFVGQVNVLADMELWGIGADMDACLRARHIIIRKLKELEKEAYKLAGKSFSLNATADIADVLYTHLKLPVPKGCGKGKLHPSTDKQSLDHLRYKFDLFVVCVISRHCKFIILASVFFPFNVPVTNFS